MSQNGKAIILAGRAIQDHEFVYPFYRLQEAGYEVDVAVRGKETVFGSIGVKIEPTKDIGEVIIDDYCVLVIPGGAKAMEYMRQDEGVLELIRQAGERNVLIASICHGAQLLISAGLVRGKKVSGYYSIKDDINNAGGEFVDVPVIHDAGIVSCPHYKYLGPWMAKTLSLLE